MGYRCIAGKTSPVKIEKLKSEIRFDKIMEEQVVLDPLAWESAPFSKSLTAKRDGSGSRRQQAQYCSCIGGSSYPTRISHAMEDPNTGNPFDFSSPARCGMPRAAEKK